MAYPNSPTTAHDNAGDHRVVPTMEARQGESTGHVRYVLGTSLALALVAGVVIYLGFFG
ncbi:MAG: hypothetical protein JO348_00075 [Alphaproteobacteria bacterium]|nr:hypothetical protein [Alphaproteobacteria bacterium]MBV9418142.1 hypothetical protein [Alphaproteobacteria bacterium]MBV9540592.1 hypothetical protein [Alphaproteobacteria bacterium]MBV9905064.1 hypothetical protein [Alphaproteobacteria bacterium]